MDKDALRYINKAFDEYVRAWPGGDPSEQENLKHIQLGLHKALLDLQLIED